MILILTRHGETVDNRNGILSGHQDGELTALGVEQSRQLAGRLKKEKIDCIYCSDLHRARQTAQEIVRYHPHVPLYFDQRLRETDYRELTGKHKLLFDFRDWSPRVESREDLQERVRSLLHEVYENHELETVLFVGHAGSSRALLTVLEKKPARAMQDIRGLTNTAIFMYEVNGTEYRKLVFNNIDHLSQARK
jgi:broad specificity phosphatase PhoE